MCDKFLTSIEDGSAQFVSLISELSLALTQSGKRTPLKRQPSDGLPWSRR